MAHDHERRHMLRKLTSSISDRDQRTADSIADRRCQAFDSLTIGTACIPANDAMQGAAWGIVHSTDMDAHNFNVRSPPIGQPYQWRLFHLT